MTDKQIEDIANRLIAAIEHLAPNGTSGWTIVASLAPLAALIAAGLVTWIGWKNLKHQRNVLAASISNDDRSEWWKRAQWALESAASTKSDMLNAAGTEMLKILVTSPMATDEDKDLLDTAWRAGTAAADEQSAEDMLLEAAVFADEEAALENDDEAGENEGTKEDTNG